MKPFSRLLQLTLLGGLVATTGCRTLAMLLDPGGPPPPVEAALHTDEIGVERVALGLAPGLGRIHEILVVVGEDGQQALALVGKRGALTMSLTGETTDEVSFRAEDCLAREPARRGDLDGDGTDEFIWVSLMCGLVVADATGDRIWAYSEGGAGSLAVADLDGDGADEIVVRFEGNNTFGWFKGGATPTKVVKDWGNIYEVLVADMDADGILEIVYGNMGDLVLRDTNGEELLRYDPDFISIAGNPTLLYFGLDLQLVPWPPGSSNLFATNCVLPGSISPRDVNTSMDSVTALVGPTGELETFLPSPLCGAHGGPGGRSVVGADGNTYMAMVANHLGDAAFFVWDGNGGLVYHEVTRGRCEAIELLPGDEGDRLLLGCGDTVWAYRLGTGQPADLSTPAASP